MAWSGNADLQEDAAAEGFVIDAEVEDIRSFKTRRRFDVIVIDRTLHMLAGWFRPEAAVQEIVDLCAK